ncbi:MAG TPA: PQQ-binding-like beta-propeller repeat protein, partial [Gammaproteobacteria bacterium]|nr:PQQ-binding-like beta-propeller repeat protein [Gammaproteobacteria bacterium]
MALTPFFAAAQQSGIPAPRGVAPAFDAAALTAPPTANWITNGGNVYNQRYSPLARIDRENVAELKAVWRADLDGSGLEPRASGQGQTLVYDGVLYVVTGEDDVFAIDVETGARRWTYKPGFDPNEVHVCCGWVNRGLAMGDGKLFLGRLDAKLVALDQATGRELWSVQAEDNHAGFSITSAPLYYDGKVITGFAGGEYGIRGRVKAFDAEDGRLLWTFYTIPGPGEPGHETWPADGDAWLHGGAPVWQTPAVDPELGLIYFSTGNPGPDLGGAVRPGDNLYSDSMIAIEADTGRYRWHFQQIHHDIWDYGAANPVVLFDAEIDGKLRKGIVEVSKAGFVYILDRATGEPLIGIEERPVPQEPRQATAATQPVPIGDAVVPQSIDMAPEEYDLVNEGRVFTPFFDKPVLYKPIAAVNWPPSSYDPETKRLYVCAGDGMNAAVADGSQFAAPSPGQVYLGGTFKRPDVPGRGVLAAMDVRTNRIAWRRQLNGRCYGGSVATAGGLIFLGRNDGRLTALDKDTGRLLWAFQLDAGVNAPPTTFEYRGEQYVAVLAGGSVYGGRRGDGLWLFSLHGTMEPLPPLPAEGDAGAAAPARPAATAPAARRSADVDSGRQIYTQA